MKTQLIKNVMNKLSVLALGSLLAIALPAHANHQPTTLSSWLNGLGVGNSTQQSQTLSNSYNVAKNRIASMNLSPSMKQALTDYYGAKVQAVIDDSYYQNNNYNSRHVRQHSDINATYQVNQMISVINSFNATSSNPIENDMVLLMSLNKSKPLNFTQNMVYELNSVSPNLLTEMYKFNIAVSNYDTPREDYYAITMINLSKQSNQTPTVAKWIEKSNSLRKERYYRSMS